MYCQVPFENIHVDVEGDVRLCCYGYRLTRVGTVLGESLPGVWSGGRARDFRNSVTDGSFRYCGDCGFPEIVMRGSQPASLDLGRVGCVTLAYDHACNLSCPSCRVGRDKPSPRAAEVHEAVMRSGIFKVAGTVSVSGSGDPFASKYFWDLVEKFPDIDCYYDLGLYLCTNGVLLTPAVLARVRACGKPIWGVEVSVDASRPETYALNRRGGDWAVLMRNIAALAREGVPLSFNFVVQQNNFREVPEFAGMFLGWGRVCFSALRNWGTFSPQEYVGRAVHLRGHPQHRQLREVLADPVLRDGRVRLAQLSDGYLDVQDSREFIRGREVR